jgi:hypothetical protein
MAYHGIEIRPLIDDAKALKLLDDYQFLCVIAKRVGDVMGVEARKRFLYEATKVGYGRKEIELVAATFCDFGE